MRIIGIDPSKTRTGIAIIDLPSLRITTDKIENVEWGAFMHWFGLQIVRADLVIVEYTPGAGDKASAKTLALQNKLLGAIAEACAWYRYPMVEISVTEWRKRILGRAPRTTTKKGGIRRYWTKGDERRGIPNNIKEAVFERIGGVGVCSENLSLDEGEAVCIALAGVQLLEEGIITFDK